MKPIHLACATAATLLVTASAGLACPAQGASGAALSYTGGQLYTRQIVTTQASGASPIANCGIPGAWGYTNQAPAYSLYLNQMDGYQLVLTVGSNCDPTLLARTPDGQWHFDDDSAGGLDPRLELENGSQLNGRVDLWVGSYDGQSCPANLALETFRAAGVADEAGDVTGGCPIAGATGQQVNFSASQLWSGQTLPVMATGTVQMSSCPTPGVGYINEAPAYTMYLSGMEGYRLDIGATTQCDSTLLVRSADGNWHFDDDSGGALNPALSLGQPGELSGRVDVWVGTYGGTTCNGTLTLQTASGAAQTPAPGGQGTATPTPGPSTAFPVQPGQMAGFAGIWSTNLGGMTLTQNGAQVSGTYGGSGSLVGTVSGNTLTGTYTWSGTQGQFEITLTDGGTAFSGTWWRPGASGDWTGTTMGDAPQDQGAAPTAPTAPAPSQPMPQGTVSYAGAWTTTAAGDMTLYQTGNQVSGTYTCCEGGQISGLVTGNVLVGTYVEDNGTDYGTVRFELAPDGRRFTGTWSRTSGGQASGAWDGTRR